MSDKNKGMSGRREKAYYSDELKQRLVIAANQPGASLSRIAQRWGVSVSALSQWCRQYQQPAAAATLIPIAIQPAEESSTIVEAITDGSPSRETPGMIEIILQRARIQISGLVDTDILRAVLKGCQDD